MKKTILFFLIILIIIAAGFLFAPKNEGQPSIVKEEPVPGVDVKLVAEGFVSPVALVPANDGTKRMFLVDQIGLIKVIDAEGKVLENNFLDLQNKLVTLSQNYDERGLLGLAFHPSFRENGRLFVYYSAPLRSGVTGDWNHTSILSEFMVDKNNPNMADPNSEKVILQIDQPQSNHNGGHITFGPEGLLYIPLGDGGAANDVGLGHAEIGNGQDITTMLGKILRIDVDKGSPYTIPEDNPFVDKEGLDEIYAYGLRNPYHISFDSGGNKELFAADAGQDLWEEVNIVTKGGNYGWNIREGSHCFDPSNAEQSAVTCLSTGLNGEPLLNPIIEYGHMGEGGGKAIVGGYVYRGEAIKELNGDYVFADWSRDFTKGDGSLFAASLDNGNWSLRELKISNGQNSRLGLFIKGMGQDEDNELYLLTTGTLGPSGESGKIFKILSPGSASTGENKEAEMEEEKVRIKNFKFEPETITIPKGTKVTWANEDSTPHTIASQGNFESNTFDQGETFSFTFEETGEFDYICGIHPEMKGKVIVE
ncbi:MAG: PQQ-dependent sugar dehydrogenase [Candidatus Shapirobacteria bacterium]|jgi:glucose/arabinose dehydrogenase/plastocyanin